MEMCRQGQALLPDSEGRSSSRQGSTGLLSAMGRKAFAPGERRDCGYQRLELLEQVTC